MPAFGYTLVSRRVFFTAVMCSLITCMVDLLCDACTALIYKSQPDRARVLLELYLAVCECVITKEERGRRAFNNGQQMEKAATLTTSALDCLTVLAGADIWRCIRA